MRGGRREENFGLDGEELDRWEWVEVGDLSDYLIPRLTRQLGQALRAKLEGLTLYLEHGRPGWVEGILATVG